MEPLIRKIKHDWYDVQEAAEDPDELEKLFSFQKSEVEEMVEDLRMSVDGGVTEYKNRSLSNLYAFMDSFQYDSRGLGDLTKVGRSLVSVLYLVLLQRLISLGTIEIQMDDQGAKVGGSSQPELKDILRYVQEQIKAEPTLKQNPSVKIILVQIGKYRTELEKMKRLLANIPAEKKESFLRNFKKTFEEISQKVQENYRILSDSEDEEAAKDYIDGNPLRRFDYRPVGTILLNQANEFSAIRSTVFFAESERFKTREILSGILDHKERIALLINTELSTFAQLSDNQNDGKIISKAFSQELIKVLNRQIARIRD